MASRRITKRKSPCQDTIFLEVNDNDLSPEHHSNEDSEPEIKIMKADEELLKDETIEILNLETEKAELTKEEIINEMSPKIIVRSCEEAENVISCDNNSKLPGFHSVKLKTPPSELEDGELNDTIIYSNEVDTTDSKLSGDSEIHISFGSKQLSDVYKLQFIKFLESFVELELIKVTDLSITIQRDPNLNPSEWIVLSESFGSGYDSEERLLGPILTPDTPTKSKKKKAKKKKKEEEIFVLDTKPSHQESNAHIAKYQSKFQIEVGAKEDENIIPKIGSVQECFNCSENHSLKDCPAPRDHTRINASRNKFKNQKQAIRYHLEENQKYGHLKPGKTTPLLREALGLRKNELPPYIYRMRFFGYPPGWLEDAKFVYSNLDMFDAEGKTVRQKNAKKNQGLDPEKIIEYPGFNIPLERHIKDEHNYYGVPAYSDKFNKEAMIKFFEKEYATQQDDYETCEMDLDTSENGKKEMKKGSDIRQLVRVKNETAEVSLPSPSLLELEHEKEKLLLALENSVNISNIISEDNTTDERKKVVTSEEANNIELQEDKLMKVDQCVNLDISTDEGISDSEKSFSNHTKIKKSTFGTPILKSKSPYSKLPVMDNFTKNVSPVVNFENLPNTTGKYEQMTEVLQKVRDKIKNFQNCKS